METLTRLPWTAQSSVFRKLEEIADVASLSRNERLKYDEGLKKYRDTISVLEGARMDGLAEGRAEGVEKEKKETAKRLASAGVDIATISIATGLPVDEIQNFLR